MFIWGRAAFWFSLFSIIICFHDYWKTIHIHDPVILMIGLGPFEPFHHWMLDFDPFEPPVTAAISAKMRGYVMHLFFFFLVGTALDKLIRNLKRKRS